jgi:hypothetical protein
MSKIIYSSTKSIITSPAFTRAVRSSMSNANSIGTNRGSGARSVSAASISNNVPPAIPLMMAKRASRCSWLVLASKKGCSVPRPRADSCSVLRYDPHRVYDARDVAEDRQKDVDPKVLGEPHLQEHPQRREKNRGHDAPKIHQKPPRRALRSDTLLPVRD